MNNRFASLALIIALVCTVGGTSAFANTPTSTDTTGNVVVTLPVPPGSAKKEGQPNDKLRAGLDKLVADTKAGKGTLSRPSQFHPSKSNNLSKGKKIAIGVGIAAVVVVAVVALHIRRHLFDDFRPFAQR
jgi:hypothetical protein